MLLIVFYSLILVNSIHQLSQISDKLTCQGFSQTMFGWEADLEIYNSDFIKITIISLNISQYLSAYAFTDSPSLIVIDSRESKGWGTLLHVMNWEQNDWVSFLKELMEFVLSPSNHLIGIGPKLKGNTLHNKASSWEWTAIFCLNWLTCSTGSMRPLYMVNVGWWKRRGAFSFLFPEWRVI